MRIQFEKESREKMEELRRMREESERKWRELKEESERKWQELKEESERKWQELKKADLELRKEFSKKFESPIGAIGAKWGISAESSFRDAMKAILEKEFPVKVERYLAKDEEGKVFGHPDQVELDLVIKKWKGYCSGDKVFYE